MTDFTTINDDEIDGRSPTTSALMVALRDNPIAITEGNNSPKIQTAALEQTGGSEAVDTNVIRDRAIANDKFASLSITFGKLASGVNADYFVTNGDSHNHAGGDGAQLHANGIQDRTLRADQLIYNNQNVGGSTFFNYQTIQPGEANAWIPEAGWYILTTGTHSTDEDLYAVTFEMNFGVGWIAANANKTPISAGLYWCDGTQMRVRNAESSAMTVWYARLVD